MLDYLVNLLERLGHWGYLVIFLGATLESAAFVGLLVPGEALVLVAGFFAAQGLLDIGDLIVIVAIGAILGDSIGYEMGRRIGRPGLERYGSRFGLINTRIAKAEAFFKRHGGKAVFLGRFVGFARALVPFLAGSSRMPYRKFFPYNALGAALWSAAILLLGYFLGASWQIAEQWTGRASVIVGGAVLIIFALGWLWHWMVRHEAQIKNRWARIREHPRVAAILERFAPQIAWLRARLSPGSYFGLQLTGGVLVFAGAAWLFGGITEDVLTGDPLVVFDLQVERWFHSHQAPWLTAVLSVVSQWHEWPTMTGVTLLLLLYLLWQRQWHWVVTTICTVPGGMLLSTLLKLVFHRARPTFSDLAAALNTYSFPSGHVMAATLIYGLTATYLATRLTAWRWRVLAVLVAFLLVTIVAFSRVYLGVHYMSDVLAAAAAGVAWLALCHMGVSTMWQRRSNH
jgi:undecaprenyl-diphosphatase